MKSIPHILITCLFLLTQAVPAQTPSHGKAFDRTMTKSRKVSVTFVGTVKSIEPLGQRELQVIPVDFDSSFAVTIHIESVTPSEVSLAVDTDRVFAVHSPAILFRAVSEDNVGKKYRFKLVWNQVDHRSRFSDLSVVGQVQEPLPSDFPTLQKVSIEELKQKTAAHVNIWGLDKIERWDLTQDSGKLVFTLRDGLVAVSPAQIIGTYNSEDHTWLWAWANSSIDKKLQVDALKVRKYGEEHHIDRLTTAKWVGTEDDAWAMVALAVKLCSEQGAYRGPSGTTYAFIAFGEVVLQKK